MRIPSPSAAVAALLLVLAAPRAGADLDVQLLNGNKAAGTFLPAGETEVFRAMVPAGARLSAAVSGTKVKKAPAPVVRMAVSDPNDAPAGEDLVQTTATGAKLPSLTADFSGLHSFRLTSTGLPGPYTFSVKWKSPAGARKFPFTFALTGDEQIETVSADAGATLTLSIAAARGSASKPRLTLVESEDGEWVSDLFEPPANDAASTHRVSGVKLGGRGGEYLVHAEEAGDEGGDAVLTVTIKPPKAVARKVDLTSKQTGTDALHQFGKGAVIGPEGGGIESLDAGSGIDGASVTVPGGALTKPVVIVLSTGSPVAAPGGGQPKGPAVSFGPDGLQFRPSGTGEKVLATIPFDPSDFDGDFTALDVYVEDAQGKVSLVTPKPYEIDPVARTVTFPVSHFSTYQVFGPARPRPGDLNADGVDDLVVPAPAANGGAGRVHVFLGRRTFAPTSVFDADLTIDGSAAGASLGASVAVGDVTGDGVADLIVGSPGNGGRVDVFPGGTGFGFAGQSLSFLPAIATVEFGHRVLVADVDGDRKGDLVVSDPGAGDPQDSPAEGAVHVWRGGPSLAGGTAAPDVTLAGGIPDLRLGVALAAGRLTGGTASDLVISALAGPAGATSGTVHVVPGGPSLASGNAYDLGVEYTGDSDGEELGAAVAVGDVNGDGAPDLVAGAPGASPYSFDTQANVPNAGTVYVFFGPSFDGGGAAIADLSTYVFPQTGQQRGRALVLGNFIGDSFPDLAVGLPGHADGVAGPRGQVTLERGGASFGLGFEIVDGDASGDVRGARILAPADVNGDGRDDLAVASPGASGGAGLVRVFLGPGMFGPQSVTIAGAPGDRLGGP